MVCAVHSPVYAKPVALQLLVQPLNTPLLKTSLRG